MCRTRKVNLPPTQSTVLLHCTGGRSEKQEDQANFPTNPGFPGIRTEYVPFLESVSPLEWNFFHPLIRLSGFYCTRYNMKAQGILCLRRESPINNNVMFIPSLLLLLFLRSERTIFIVVADVTIGRRRELREDNDDRIREAWELRDRRVDLKSL